MKVLFAVSNEEISDRIIKKYQKDYREILAYKNVYYFNAILKEIQKDKTYDRIVVSEDLEPFANNNYDTIDKFIFDKLDSISDEAGEIPIILICTERRAKSSNFLVKLFSLGIYNALLGNDRSMDQVCKLISRPRGKKEAKMYYKIDADDANYKAENENEVSEIEIQNILTHFKKLGRNTEKYTESFNNIAAQYTDEQLKIIINCLPIKVKAVLEEQSPKYQELMNASGVRSVGNQFTSDQSLKNAGLSINMIGDQSQKLSGPIVIPNAVRTSKINKPINIKPEIAAQAAQINSARTIKAQAKPQGQAPQMPPQPQAPQRPPMPNANPAGMPNMNVPQPNGMQPQMGGMGQAPQMPQQPQAPQRPPMPNANPAGMPNMNVPQPNGMQPQMGGMGQAPQMPQQPQAPQRPPMPNGGMPGQPNMAGALGQMPNMGQPMPNVNPAVAQNASPVNPVATPNFSQVQNNVAPVAPEPTVPTPEPTVAPKPMVEPEIPVEEPFMPGVPDMPEAPVDDLLPGVEQEPPMDDLLPGVEPTAEAPADDLLPGVEPVPELPQDNPLPDVDAIPGLDDLLKVDDEPVEQPVSKPEESAAMEDINDILAGVNIQEPEATQDVVEPEIPMPNLTDEEDEEELPSIAKSESEEEKSAEDEAAFAELLAGGAQSATGNVPEPAPQEEPELPADDLLPGMVPEPELPMDDLLPGVEPTVETPADDLLPGIEPQAEASVDDLLPGVEPQAEAPVDDLLPGIEPQAEAPVDDLLPGIEPQAEAPIDNLVAGVAPTAEMPAANPVPEVAPTAEMPVDEFGMTDAVTIPGLDELDNLDVEPEDLIPGMEAILNDDEGAPELPNNPVVDNNLNGESAQQVYNDYNANTPNVDESAINYNQYESTPVQNNYAAPEIAGTMEPQQEVQSLKPKIDYSMSSFHGLLTADKKVVTFIGTPKNGTSFLVNNLASLFSSVGLNTAILDMTKNKNSYYIYTKNDETLRKTAYTSISDLMHGKANGIHVDKNLTVYTALPNDGKDYSNAEPILSTLVQNHSIVLIDCDFTTDPSYFALCKEIYLVQSLDILTIQPLTSFLRDLKAQNVLEPEKIRVVINKNMRVGSLTTKILIAGMSFYNDPAMSFMTELFNKDLVKYCEIPFDEKAYAKYLESMVNCSIIVNSYPQGFVQKLKILGDMVYPLTSKQSYGKPNGGFAANNSFSNSMNNTLNKMKKTF